MALMRLWQGKVIMWTLLVPFSILTTHRFMTKPSIYVWALAASMNIAAGGLSATGLFLVPAAVILSAAAYVLTADISWPAIRRAFLINLSSTYSVLILALMYFGYLPLQNLEDVFQDWPQTWKTNLSLVINSPLILLRNISLLVFVPAIVLTRDKTRFVVVYSFLASALFLSPVAAEILLPLIQPGAYWRLIYLLPIPLCFGMLVSNFSDLSKLRCLSGHKKIAIAAASALTALSFEGASFIPSDSQSGIVFKSAGTYRFPGAEMEFAASIKEQVTGRHVLAPERISHVLPLISPTIRLHAARAFQTKFTFSAYGHALEGEQRVSAQRAVTSCVSGARDWGAVLQAIEKGVDAIIIATSPTSAHCSTSISDAVGTEWQEVADTRIYKLFLKLPPET